MPLPAALLLLASLQTGAPTVAPTAAPVTVAPVTADAKTMEARIDAAMERVVGKTTPGLVVVVQQGPRTLYRKASGFADLAGKTPLTPETPMKIASLTKAFTAAVIQGLAADGKLGLDAPIRPFFPAAPTSWDGITVRNLLNHTSGLADYTDGMRLAMAKGPLKDPAEIAAWAAKTPAHFAPGEKFEYSNTNYFLLGLVAERAGGAALENQMRTRIFTPLAMTTATLPRTGLAVPDEPVGARVVGGKLLPARKADLSWPFAAGALVMSADDLARWIGGIAGGKVLTEAQRTAAFTPAELKGGDLSFYGFGWILGTHGMAPAISHGGGIEGFSSYVAYLPATDVRIVILADSEDADTYALAEPILDAVEGKATVPKVADADPKLTARLRGIAERMLKGERDATQFAPAFLKAVPDDLWAKTGKGLGELGELEEFTLVSAEKSAAGRTRAYRMTVGDATLTATFTIGTDGKISGLRLS